jgi:hypothetical protein
MSKSPEPIAPAPAPAARDAPSDAGVLQAIWQRIKAHKVVQWTLAYLAVAYTLLHGAEMLVSSLSWPHAGLRVFALLLILGVPVVITLAWYHGAYRRSRVSATEIMIIALLLALGGAFLWQDTKSRHGAGEGAAAAAGRESQPLEAQ